MSRKPKNSSIREEMCGRFKKLAEQYLQLSIRELSEYMGYANTTVLRKVWKGETFPDTEKLAKLAEIKNAQGQVPNIHWLVTAEGDPVINPANQKGVRDNRTKLKNVVDNLPALKVSHLLKFLTS